MRKAAAIGLAFCLFWIGGIAAQDPGTSTKTSELHPVIQLLDRLGNPVLQDNTAISPLVTCGKCHDTAAIASSSYHATAGIKEIGEVGAFPGARPWELGPGLYGRWDPLVNVWPLIADSSRLDSEQWTRQLGYLHTGGGPSVMHAAESYEMDCLLCHLAAPANAMRIKELETGRLAWAATATLGGTGLVEKSDNGWRWNADELLADSKVSAKRLGLQAAKSTACGLCHGVVHKAADPLTLSHESGVVKADATGQVYSSQRISASGLNLQDKSWLTRPWDIHAERLLECTECHYAQGNPALAFEADATRPPHLSYDPRKADIASYLKSPSHRLVKGDSAQGLVAQQLDQSMRRCADCHDVEDSHSKWLPYVKRHLNTLSCEACHIPHQYSPALSQIDWTLLSPDGKPLTAYRGAAEGVLPGQQVFQPQTLITGYQPVLLPREDIDRQRRLYPYNLVLAWYWVGKKAGSTSDGLQPVTGEMLAKAIFKDRKYKLELLAILDSNQNGELSFNELRLDMPQKTALVTQLLEQAGITDARIVSELLPYDLHHGVATADWATRECAECHSADSRIAQVMPLNLATPNSAAPQLVADDSVQLAGLLRADGEGALVYLPVNAQSRIYILGHDRWLWGDRIGLAAILLVIAGVLAHGAVRVSLALRRRAQGAGR